MISTSFSLLPHLQLFPGSKVRSPHHTPLHMRSYFSHFIIFSSIFFFHHRISHTSAMMGFSMLTPNYRRELQKHSTKKRKCYCLRGGVKLANCFGPWDHLSLEVPASKVNKDHISSGNFLLNEIRQSRCCRPTASRPEEMSLSYLSRLGRGGAGEGHLRFRHFESVGEHIRYYRENKPNSLYQPADCDQQSSTKHHNTPVEDV